MIQDSNGAPNGCFGTIWEALLAQSWLTWSHCLNAFMHLAYQGDFFEHFVSSSCVFGRVGGRGWPPRVKAQRGLRPLPPGPVSAGDQ